MSRGHIEISGGALVLCALLFYLDQSGVVGPLLLFSLCHELGHWQAVKSLGGRVVGFRLTWAGAQLRLSGAHPLPPSWMALAALAGPGTNLLLAFGCALLARHGAGGRLYLYAGVNLGLAAFNLLPARWLDGGRALESLLACMGREGWTDSLLTVCSWCVTGLLLLAGPLLLWESEGRNFTVLLAGLWMIRGALGEDQE